MSKTLSTSEIERRNVLNNPYAVEEIQKAVNLQGFVFEDKLVFTKEQIASFFEVSERTIDNYLSKYEDELVDNGYEVLRGKRLKNFKLTIEERDDGEIDFAIIKKTARLGLFNFSAFLNIGMLITESERARLLRQAILDIVIDLMNRKAGGGTKYINQRDEDFLHSWFEEENYRKKFTDALKDYVDMGNFKYPMYTNKIYESIFKENAQEYRKILRLKQNDVVRNTFYSEILDLVASYENGLAEALEKEAKDKDHKLSQYEVDQVFERFNDFPHWKPLLEKARMKMASRDLAFRDALHKQLKDYVIPLDRKEFERFLGEKSKELEGRLEDAQDVLKRLKDR
jgi:transposase